MAKPDFFFFFSLYTISHFSILSIKRRDEQHIHSVIKRKKQKKQKKKSIVKSSAKKVRYGNTGNISEKK